MTQLIISLLAIYGLAFFIKDSSGPWGIMSWIRSILIRNKYVGVFFYNFLLCYFCVGTHCGYVVYLLSTPMSQWTINGFVLWSFAGAAFSFIMNSIIEKIAGD
jgi:hypothetical protein